MSRFRSILALLAVTAVGCKEGTSISEVEQAALHRAMEALRQGDYDEAGRLAERLAKTHPSASLTALLGVARFRAGKVDEAITALERAQKLDPADPEVAMARVLAYLASDKTDKAEAAARLAQATLVAETTLSRAIAAGGLDRGRTAEALQRAGEEHLRAGQSTAALGVFKEASVLDPKLATARLLTGSALYNLKAYKRAVVELRAAIELGAPSSGAWKLIGHSMMQLGDPKTAREAYAQVLRVSPSDPDARRAMAGLSGQPLLPAQNPPGATPPVPPNPPPEATASPRPPGPVPAPGPVAPTTSAAPKAPAERTSPRK